MLFVNKMKTFIWKTLNFKQFYRDIITSPILSDVPEDKRISLYLHEQLFGFVARVFVRDIRSPSLTK